MQLHLLKQRVKGGGCKQQGPNAIQNTGKKELVIYLAGNQSSYSAHNPAKLNNGRFFEVSAADALKYFWAHYWEHGVTKGLIWICAYKVTRKTISSQHRNPHVVTID